MSRIYRSGMIFTLALAIPGALAFGQAAAESVLLGAGSSTATIKAGSTLGSALNRGGKQSGERLQKQVSHPATGKLLPAGARQASTNPVKHSAVPTATTAAKGSIVASIQGAQISCSGQAASTSGSKTNAEPARTGCTAASGKATAQKYQSVITLAAPK